MYLIVCNSKMNGNDSLHSFKKQVILKPKMKTHFHEIASLVWFNTLPYREIAIFLKEIYYYFLEFVSFLT